MPDPPPLSPPPSPSPSPSPALAPAPARSWIPAKSWTHFVAGGLGGMCGAIVTSPFDVVKTRLQSSMFAHTRALAPSLASALASPPLPPLASLSSTAAAAPVPANRIGSLLWNFVETAYLIRDIYKYEGPSALFKGLGPTLVGVVPARSINFFTYGNGKQVIAEKFNSGREETWVFLSAAALAGMVTSTATNPIWVIKTRLQLSASSLTPFTSSYACIVHILRTDGLRGMYKGLSASYLGATEGVIQWTLYENMKRWGGFQGGGGGGGRGGGWEWGGMLLSAGGAKMVASLITYPHEVVRTRLRQPPIDGLHKYRGLLQTFRVVLAEEGLKSLYGGLSAHLLRVVPNAAVMYSIYEGVLRWNGVRSSQ